MTAYAALSLLAGVLTLIPFPEDHPGCVMDIIDYEMLAAPNWWPPPMPAPAPPGPSFL